MAIQKINHNCETRLQKGIILFQISLLVQESLTEEVAMRNFYRLKMVN